MNKLPLFLLLAAVLIVGLMLTVCDSVLTSLAAQPCEKNPTELASGITIVDSLDRSVQFDAPPQRVVVAGQSSLTIIDTMYLFPEAKQRVVAVTSGRQKPGDFLAHVDSSFREKTLLGHDSGPEQIAPLHPDVVILRSFMAGKLGKSLEQLDIPVVYVDLETPEQYFRDVGTLGKLLGNEARAEEIQSFYQERLDRIDGTLGELSDDQKPSVLIVQYSDKGGHIAFNVPSSSWLQTAQAKLAGGFPIWTEAAQGGGWTVVNFEQIAAWGPDKIIVVSYKTDSSQVVEKLKSDAQWQVLEAVQERHIYGFPADIFSWDQPDPRWVLGVTWLAGKMHPDHFSGLDMMEEISAFFGQMYGMDEDSIQEHIVPNLKGDIQ